MTRKTDISKAAAGAFAVGAALLALAAALRSKPMNDPASPNQPTGKPTPKAKPKPAQNGTRLTTHLYIWGTALIIYVSFCIGVAMVIEGRQDVLGFMVDALPTSAIAYLPSIACYVAVPIVQEIQKKRQVRGRNP